MVVSIIAALIAVSFGCSGLHLYYTADSLAQHTGYFVSVVLFPVAYGGAFGVIGAYMLRKRYDTSKIIYPLMTASCIFAALTPTFIYYVAASIPHSPTT